MCVNSIKVKYCEKHNCSYIQRGSSDRMHCRECTNERNRNTVRSQKAKENKRDYDKKYAIKKRLENPDVLKQAQEKYKLSLKFQERKNYYKYKSNEGKFSNLYCIECNNVRLYGDKICDKYKINNKKIIEQHIELYHIDGINYGDWSICRRDRKDITNNNFIAKNPYPNDYRGYNNFATLYSIILKSNCLYTYHLLRVILFSFFMNEKQTDEALFSDLFISYKTINAEDKPSNYSFAKRYNVMFDK